MDSNDTEGTMEKIALFGATGAIGNSLAAALRQAGRPYRVVGRSRPALEKAFGRDPLAELVTWDPEDPASVRAAARGVDAIVYGVGVNYWQFEQHPRLMEKTLAGAIAEKVQRFVLIGTVYPYGRPRTALVREDHPREPHTFKGRMRLEQEELLLRAHREGKIRGTVLRLPDFYGPGVDKSFLDSAINAAVRGGKADLIGPIDRPHELIFVPDVGPVVLRVIASDGAWGRWWHLSGAGVTSIAAMVGEVERQIGRPLPRRVVGKTLLRVLGLFNPMLRELVEMHYLLTDPVVLDGSALEALIGPITRTPYAEGVRQTLAAAQRRSGTPAVEKVAIPSSTPTAARIS